MDRKSEIIKLTHHLIREKGYDGFSYLDLSKALGITKASIHYHFPSKEDLGIALLDWIHLELINGKDNLMSLDSARHRVEAIIGYYIEISETNLICPISSLQLSWNRLPDKLKERLREMTEFEVTYLADLINEGQTDGTFTSTLPSAMLAKTILATLKGLLQYNRTLQLADTQEHMKTVLSILNK